ncbi:Indole-3-glycerol phosphate synthase [Candidatus Xiphinematobacter sp. Idaho Grape]|uniref:indole-3-glycerol phosphate synthase TrpC n=1 Tax=Candidatus Xiphinematobacter sp. Idaho Grape TaxID=1704307 RepID=UPI000706298D|nr:indole-3-glycerol phosphate synthase TrpC [Candidatus Xiphinematobacter sp. Idaho Grape]ALJ56301.1 Indole-3-glycerol phosphate synthase [Candidatus Xiphinematobacter sp. Idaho Grape]
MTFLEEILKAVRKELSSAKIQRTPADLRSMVADAPPVIALDQKLRSSFCLIAEIKEKSPSVGPMRAENVKSAPEAYEEASIVQAISVLTNFSYFGMSIQKLGEIRKNSSKPILRKDFIVEEYQIWEARAFGADALLLMANVLDVPRLRGFYDLCRELGMEALFEVHTDEEIHLLPPDAKIVGINSRRFKDKGGFVGVTGMSNEDLSVNLDAFQLVEKLPVAAIRVAESGLSPSMLGHVRGKFQAALVGTSLLRDNLGVRAGLADFEKQLSCGKS